jgi:hypothetical protein
MHFPFSRFSFWSLSGAESGDACERGKYERQPDVGRSECLFVGWDSAGLP